MGNTTSKLQAATCFNTVQLPWLLKCQSVHTVQVISKFHFALQAKLGQAMHRPAGQIVDLGDRQRPNIEDCQVRTIFRDIEISSISKWRQGVGTQRPLLMSKARWAMKILHNAYLRKTSCCSTVHLARDGADPLHRDDCDVAMITLMSCQIQLVWVRGYLGPNKFRMGLKETSWQIPLLEKRQTWQRPSVAFHWI